MNRKEFIGRGIAQGGVLYAYYKGDIGKGAALAASAGLWLDRPSHWLVGALATSPAATPIGAGLIAGYMIDNPEVWVPYLEEYYPFQYKYLRGDSLQGATPALILNLAITDAHRMFRTF